MAVCETSFRFRLKLHHLPYHFENLIILLFAFVGLCHQNDVAKSFFFLLKSYNTDAWVLIAGIFAGKQSSFAKLRNDFDEIARLCNLIWIFYAIFSSCALFGSNISCQITTVIALIQLLLFLANIVFLCVSYHIEMDTQSNPHPIESIFIFFFVYNKAVFWLQYMYRGIFTK